MFDHYPNFTGIVLELWPNDESSLVLHLLDHLSEGPNPVVGKAPTEGNLEK